METTERIVEAYLRHVMGCATLTNIRCRGQNEIDLLAIHPRTLERYHVEVSISISQSFRKLTAKAYDPEVAKQRVQQASQRRTVGFFEQKKFGAPSVIERLAEFGFEPGNYVRAIATWGWTDEADTAARAAGIELWDFRKIVGDIADQVAGTGGYFTDDIVRTLHLFSEAIKETDRGEKPRNAGKAKPATQGNLAQTGDRYWVYANVPNDKALIHLHNCSHCNGGQGRTADKLDHNGQWHGPFDANEARQTARQTGKKRIQWCGFCARKLGISPDDV